MPFSNNRTKILSPWAEGDRALLKPSEDSHRGGGRVELSEEQKRYISLHIGRYQTYTERSRQPIISLHTIQMLFSARQDSLWRIASCADLFDDLDPEGSLTDEQWNEAIGFIEQFQRGQAR